MSGGVWTDLRGKITVEYGVHETGAPVVVLRSTHEENGTEVLVALDFDQCRTVIDGMAQAWAYAKAAAADKAKAVPS